MTLKQWSIPLISLLLFAGMAYYTSTNERVDLLQAVPQVKERRLPSALIIGVRKCGTRALLDFLDVHPSVKTAREEIHFFDQPENFKIRGLSWYKEQMPESDSREVTLEKTPAYFNYPGVAYRVYKMSKSTKLLLVVRDPVTRLLSDYLQYQANRKSRNLTCLDFESTVTTIEGRVDRRAKIVRLSRYVDYIASWIKLFPLSQIHVVDGDKLVSDPYSEMKLVERFLSLKAYFNREQFVFNSERGFYCITHESTDQKTSAPLRTSSTKDVEICLGASKGRRHPKVDKRLLTMFRSYFSPYNEAFYSAVHRNFNWTSS